MLKNLIATFKWNLKLATKLAQDLPFYTLSITSLTLLAQICTLLTFLLPIKIIMIAGLDNTPLLFSNTFGDIEKKTIVLSLILLTIILFIVQGIAKKLSIKASSKGANKVLSKCEKLIIFENQSEIAKNSYKQLCECIAGVIFTIVALAGAAFLYPDAILSMLLFIFFYTLVVEIYAKKNTNYKASLLEEAPNHFNNFLTLSFLLLFCYITIDFLYFSHPGFSSGILSLIIIRQTNARLGLTVGNIFSLRKKSSKLDALFFRDNIFSKKIAHRTEDIYDFLSTISFPEDLSQKVYEETSLLIDTSTQKWIESGVNNTIFLKFKTQHLPTKTLLIKLFNKRQTSSAIHEATLLLDKPLGLPTPELLCATSLDNYHLHVLDITGASPLTPKAYKALQSVIANQLTNTAIPEELLDKYKRSRHLLYDRLNNEMFRRLKLAAREGQLGSIVECESNLPELQSILKELPLILDLPTSWKSVWTTSNNNPLLLHCSSWKIDVAGTNWDAELTQPSTFTAFLEECQLIQFKTISHCDRKMMLASLVHKAEKEYIQQLYVTCAKTWVQINALLSELRK